MKISPLFLFICLLLMTSCGNEDKVPDYMLLPAEKNYPAYFARYEINSLAGNSMEVFKYKLYSINSTERLDVNPLFARCPDTLKVRLRGCDFEKYSLILTSCMSISQIYGVRNTLKHWMHADTYDCIQTIYTNDPPSSIDSVYISVSAFAVEKLPDNANISFSYVTKR